MGSRHATVRSEDRNGLVQFAAEPNRPMGGVARPTPLAETILASIPVRIRLRRSDRRPRLLKYSL